MERREKTEAKRNNRKGTTVDINREGEKERMNHILIKRVEYLFIPPRERKTENSELYYTRIKILGSCLFLQSVPANLHANRLHIKH